MRVIPAPGLQFRDPRTKRLIPPEGVDVEPTNLDFVRALECGDVVEVKAGPAAKTDGAAQ
jgi:hypothetical protein